MKYKSCRKFSCDTCTQIIEVLQVDHQENKTTKFQTKEVVTLLNQNHKKNNKPNVNRTTIIGHLKTMSEIGRLERVGSENRTQYKIGEIYHDVRKLFKEFEKELLAYWDAPNSLNRYGILNPVEWEKLVLEAEFGFEKTKIAIKQSRTTFLRMIQTSMQKIYYSNGLRFSFPEFRVLVKNRCSICKRELKQNELAFLTCKIEFTISLSTIPYSEFLPDEMNELDSTEREVIIGKYVEDGYIDGLYQRYLDLHPGYGSIIKEYDEQFFSIQKPIEEIESKILSKLKPFWIWKINAKVTEIGLRHSNDLTNYSGGFSIENINTKLNQLEARFKLEKGIIANNLPEVGLIKDKCHYCKFPLNWGLFVDNDSLEKILYDSNREYNPIWTHYLYMIHNSNTFDTYGVYDDLDEVNLHRESLDALHINEQWIFQIPFRLIDNAKYHLFCVDKRIKE
ncbi:MAG: hypothetical protein HeimC2_00490 [Candidatus Heimdallarchaeota archaeon LC_2]|nr:MAG: hypothetical protein HeimC2_00490 [Candidatus Heimdallarchaeota archaeon LC_2]